MQITRMQPEFAKIAKYQDLYVQSDTLLLAYVIDNSQNTLLKVYELDPACFFTAPEVAWQAVLKKTRVK